MRNQLTLNASEFRARALLIADRIDLRALEKLDVLATTPLTVAVRGGGIAVAFRCGAAVLFGVAAQDELAFLDTLRPRLTNAYVTAETEQVDVRVLATKEILTGGVVTIEELSVERLQLIAGVLAKSVVLALYETRIASTFDRVEPLASTLEQSGQIKGQAKALLKHNGATFRIDHRMVGRVEVAEKPELLWEHLELEGLFIRLEDEFEIRERYVVLERKMNVISRTAETLLELI
jgi:required for meiotic nuclear division protein 1